MEISVIHKLLPWLTESKTVILFQFPLCIMNYTTFLLSGLTMTIEVLIL